MKQQQVADRLRRRIVEGELAPTSRLPVWREMAQEYDVSLMTIKSAVDILLSEGFVESRGTAGTYVHEQPPHLSRIVIAFDVPPNHHVFTRFLRATSDEASALRTLDQRQVEIIYGIDGHADNEDYQKLISDVRRQRLAGIIFASRVGNWASESPLFEDNRVPMVHVGPTQPEIGLGGIRLDSRSFFDQALDYFKSVGRRRIALIHGPLKPDTAEYVRQGLAKRSMQTQPYWWHRIAVSSPEAAKNITHLLMRLPKEDRPDALLISDDNAVEWATGGLVATDVSVPDDLHVVAHCNFPWPAPSVVPVARLGFDTRAMLRLAIDDLDARRGADLPPRELRIPATWESNLQPPRAP